MVPPMCVVDPSGMKITAGSGQLGTISVECACLIPSTFLANSITAACMPRQIPRNGVLDSRAYCAARIFPSVPRSPNPPGTRMPSTDLTLPHASSYATSFSTRCASSSIPASTHTICSLRSLATALCISAFVTDRYESPKPVYLPTIAMVTGTVTLSHLFARCAQASRSSLRKSSFSCRMIARCPPCSCITRGTCQMFDTSHRFKMQSGVTWQNSASLSSTACSRGSLERHASMCGDSPALRSACTECCVGFVFCSPPSAPTTGTSETCTKQKLCVPTRHCSCRTASMKGIDSISPTVPPSSMMQTSGCPSCPSTGIFATRSIHSWISSVTCGITWTVFPKYSPFLSFAITAW
mmetsp:Transcript_10287/g.38139  ORF Transcript_10287/g.38139 Transcript_10287/m.38139 type:complete len:353 (+) Transcript_10287:527-1585(+)